VAEISLDGASVMAVVGELEPAGVPQHVRTRNRATRPDHRKRQGAALGQPPDFELSIADARRRAVVPKGLTFPARTPTIRGEYIFPSRCYALAGLQLLLSFDDHLTSPVPLNRRRLRRLGTQLPEGARIAPGRPLDAFAVGSRALGGCAALQTRGPGEAHIRKRCFGWSPFGRSHGRYYCNPLRSLPLSLRADAMKRRSRAGGKPVKPLSRRVSKPKGRSAPKPLSHHGAAPARETKVAQLARERDEAVEQQAATANVLRVISSSPTDIQLVFNTIVRTASELCAAEYAILFRLRDGQYHVACSNNAEAVFIRYFSKHPINVDRGSLVGRTAIERRSAHITDCLSDPEYKLREPG
jgi:hypothetical protein